MRLFNFFSAVLLLLSIAITCETIHAAEFVSDEHVVFEAGDVWKGDVYAVGQSVKVDGEITGDLVVFCQALEIHGKIGGSLIAATQQTIIDGSIGDATRIAGHSAKLLPNAKIDGDLIAAGFSLELQEGSNVDGDLVYAGYQLLQVGDVEEDVWAGASRADIQGKIGRELSITTDGRNEPDQAVGQNFQQLPLFKLPILPAGLNIRDTASIGSKITHLSPDEADISQGATVEGPVEWMKPVVGVQAAAKPKTKTQLFVEQLKRYGTFIVLGLLMIVFCPKFTGNAARMIVERPIASFFSGFLAFPFSLLVIGLIAALIVIIPAILGLLTLSDLATAGSLLAFFSLLVYVGSWICFFGFGTVVLASVAIGRIVLTDPTNSDRGKLFLALAFGLVFFVVMTCVPYLKDAIPYLVVLFAFGGTAIWLISSLLGVKVTPRANGEPV